MRISLICFAMTIYQANGCIDLLARSFNELFSPIIETGAGRIRKPHNVDDLTDLYRTDEYGNIIPIRQVMSGQHLQQEQDESGEEIVGQKRLDFVSEPKLGCRSTPAPNSDGSEVPSGTTDQADRSPYNDVPRKHAKNRGAFYVPGRRPLVDFLIKLVESFQLTSTSKFITSRPRYENSQLQYLPNTYHDIY